MMPELFLEEITPYPSNSPIYASPETPSVLNFMNNVGEKSRSGSSNQFQTSSQPRVLQVRTQWKLNSGQHYQSNSKPQHQKYIQEEIVKLKRAVLDQKDKLVAIQKQNLQEKKLLEEEIENLRQRLHLELSNLGGNVYVENEMSHLLCELKYLQNQVNELNRRGETKTGFNQRNLDIRQKEAELEKLRNSLLETSSNLQNEEKLKLLQELKEVQRKLDELKRQVEEETLKNIQDGENFSGLSDGFQVPLKQLEKEITEKEAKLNSLNRKNQNLMGQLKSKDLQIQDLQNQLKNSNLFKKGDDSEAAQLALKLKDATDQIEELKALLEAERTTHISVNDPSQKTELEVQYQNRERQTLEKHRQELESLRTEIQTEKAQHLKDLEVLKMTKLELQNFQQNQEKLAKENQVLHQMLSSIQNFNGGIHNQLDEQMDRISDLERLLNDESSPQVKQLLEENNQIRHKATILEKEKKNLEGTVEGLEIELEKLRQKIEQQKNPSKKIISNSRESSIIECEEEKQDVQNTNSQLLQRLSEMKLKYNEETKKRLELEEEKKQLEQVLTSQKLQPTSSNELGFTIDENDNDIEKLKKELEQEKIEKQNTEERANELQQQILELQLDRFDEEEEEKKSFSYQSFSQVN